MFCFGLSPLPVTVTTRIITFLVGDPYKPSFATVTGRGDNPSYVSSQECALNYDTKNDFSHKKKIVGSLKTVR